MPTGVYARALRLCSVEGCDRKHLSRGLCNTHYLRNRLFGRLERLPVPSLEERLWSRVVRGDGCWEWQGNRDGNGYGRIGRGNKTPLVHRVAYELTYGPIADEADVCHRCDNPPCVRPNHLFIGTHQDNMADMVTKNRNTRGERVGNHKLSACDVQAIRAAYQPGLITQRELGRRFGISASMVSCITRGANWKGI